MISWAPRTCANCWSLLSQHNGDAFTEEETLSLKSCWGKFWGSRLVIGAEALGFGSSVAFCIAGGLAGNFANSTVVTELVGVRAHLWGGMFGLGVVSAVGAVFSATSYCYSESGTQEDRNNVYEILVEDVYKRTTLYEAENTERDLYSDEDS